MKKINFTLSGERAKQGKKVNFWVVKNRLLEIGRIFPGPRVEN